MGIIDDYYGGYENLAMYTNEDGDVDFDAAYGTTYEDTFNERFDQVVRDYQREHGKLASYCSDDSDVSGHSCSDFGEDHQLVRAVRKLCTKAEMRAENHACERTTDRCSLDPPALAARVCLVADLGLLTTDEALASKTLRRSADLDGFDWGMAQAVQTANSIRAHEGYGSWREYGQDAAQKKRHRAVLQQHNTQQQEGGAQGPPYCIIQAASAWCCLIGCLPTTSNSAQFWKSNTSHVHTMLFINCQLALYRYCMSQERGRD